MPEEWLNAASRPIKAARMDSSVPNVARVWNYLVGGRDNFEADRRAAQPAHRRRRPSWRTWRRHPARSSAGPSRYLAAEAGIRQFLDIGTGMPTAGNTHEVAQAVDPACRIVYVDNDPVVLSHARAGCARPPRASISYLDADARDTQAIIDGARADPRPRPGRSASS